MGLSIDNVRAVLQRQNKDEPKGAIDGDRVSFTVNANDQLFTADQYKNLIIGEKNGVPIPLSAVGRAIDATEDRLQAAWFNSKRAVVMFVRKQADANVIETVDRIKAILPQLQRWLPPAIHLQIQSDQTLTIRASVADVQTALLISVALVVMVCFLFLRRVSTTFIVCVTVPLALAGTFAMMYLLKFSLTTSRSWRLRSRSGSWSMTPLLLSKTSFASWSKG
jgi:multidrug efflux pump subunit AcrB